jgi:imidazolonepropionase-like amidohydrolase
MRAIAPLTGRAGTIAPAADNKLVYVGNLGHVLRVVPASGDRRTVPFRAQVTLAVQARVEPRPWRPVSPGASAAPRTVADPRLSPDGARVMFRAAGRLWEQRVAGNEPARMLGKDGLPDAYDASYSPDGKRIAYTNYPGDYAELHVLDLASGATRRIGRAAEDSAEECGIEYPVWSASGKIVAAKECAHDIVMIDPVTDSVRVLTKTSDWEPYPYLSADGRTLHYQARIDGRPAALYRLGLAPGSKPEVVTTAERDGINVAVSATWVASPVVNYVGLKTTRIDAAGRVAATELLPHADGHHFSFSADGTKLLYVANGKLWLHPLGGGTSREIPIRLKLVAPAAPPPVLLQRVRILDFTAGGFSRETSLLIEGGRIRSIGTDAAAAAPPGTMRIDAAGRFAIPGLFDVHMHGSGCGNANHVMLGVTSGRNLGGRLEDQNRYSDGVEFTTDARPRCFYAGRILEGSVGRDEDHFFVYPTDTTDARALVRRWHEGGAQFIKLYRRLPWPMHRAAADEARKLGLPVVAHGQSVEEIVKGITLGYAELTHWTPYTFDDLHQLIAVAGVPWDPTLGVMGGSEIAFRRDPTRYASGRGGQRTIADNVLLGQWKMQLDGVLAAYRRGMVVLAGTDWGPAGRSLHWELEFLAEAGIPTLDVLRGATLRSAELVGAGAQLGSLEPGKLADIVLLDADPLHDIRNAQKIWRVITGGRVHDPRAPR